MGRDVNPWADQPRLEGIDWEGYVLDDAPQPWLCLDCGADAEGYMVHDWVWRRTRLDPEARGEFLCFACLGTRLGRRLRRTDFSDVPANDPWLYGHAPYAPKGARRGGQIHQAAP